MSLRVFNHPIEVGSRCLILLHLLGKPLTTEQLVMLDYLLTHSGDFPGGPKSLHAEIPKRRGELTVKHSLISQGLRIFSEKGLINPVYSEDGMYFKAADLAGKYLDYFESKYFKKLQSVVEWIKTTSPFDNEQSLKKYLKDQIGDWEYSFSSTSGESNVEA